MFGMRSPVLSLWSVLQATRWPDPDHQWTLEDHTMASSTDRAGRERIHRFVCRWLLLAVAISFTFNFEVFFNPLWQALMRSYLILTLEIWYTGCPKMRLSLGILESNSFNGWLEALNCWGLKMVLTVRMKFVHFFDNVIHEYNPIKILKTIFILGHPVKLEMNLMFHWLIT